MRNYSSKLYNWTYDLICPFSFFSFFGILIATGITQNKYIFLIGSIILMIIEISAMFYLWFDWDDIKFWYKKKHGYKLESHERQLWDNLIYKANKGYVEWFVQTQGNDMCGPWILDYTPEENDLLEKIHRYFYGDDWYIAMPISGAQVNYVMYDDVKDKVRY